MCTACSGSSLVFQLHVLFSWYLCYFLHGVEPVSISRKGSGFTSSGFIEVRRALTSADFLLQPFDAFRDASQSCTIIPRRAYQAAAGVTPQTVAWQQLVLGQRQRPSVRIPLPASSSSKAAKNVVDNEDLTGSTLGRSRNGPVEQQFQLRGRYCCSVSSTQRLPTRTVVVGGGEAGAKAFDLLQAASLSAQQQLVRQLAQHHRHRLQQAQPAGRNDDFLHLEGGVLLGSSHRLAVQTMANSDTRDVDATVQQASIEAVLLPAYLRAALCKCYAFMHAIAMCACRCCAAQLQGPTWCD